MWQATRYMSTDEPVPDQSEDQVPKTGIEQLTENLRGKSIG